LASIFIHVRAREVNIYKENIISEVSYFNYKKNKDKGFKGVIYLSIRYLVMQGNVLSNGLRA
jgi:hypothetical protein